MFKVYKKILHSGLSPESTPILFIGDPIRRKLDKTLKLCYDLLTFILNLECKI